MIKSLARNFGEDRPIDFPRGAFNKSKSRSGSYDMGLLYPVYATECMPTERYEVGNTINLAFTETLSAIRHEVNCVIDWYYMPYAAMANITEEEKAYLAGLTNDQKLGYYDPRYGFRNAYFEKLITGGFDGKNVDTLQGYEPVGSDLNVGSLWDHFGLPMTIDAADYQYNKINVGLWRMYEAVYNWNYRDENWQSAYNATGATKSVPSDPSETILGNLNACPIVTGKQIGRAHV